MSEDGDYSDRIVHIRGAFRADQNGKFIRAVEEDDADFTEESIPPRPWLVPGYLLRRSVTMLAGPGSAGKSSLMIGWAVALVLKKDWNRFKPLQTCSVALYNVEDDPDEQKRRIAAVLRQFEDIPTSLVGKLIRLSPNGSGTLIRYNPDTRLWEHTEAMQALIDMLVRRKPDVLILDPFVELHDAEENDNTAIRAVLAMFRVIATTHNCAIVILHHTRKNSEESAGDMDVFRGAGSSVAAARIALTVLPMNKKEAENLQIEEDKRRSYVRMDSAKSNYAAANSAEWFKLTEYELDNQEMVAAAVPWKPPNDVADSNGEQNIREEIAKGLDGVPFSPRCCKTEIRSIVHVLARAGIVTLQGQKKYLSRLLTEGFVSRRFRNRRREWATGIQAPNGSPKADWE
jgi:RecA-family ATPase